MREIAWPRPQIGPNAMSCMHTIKICEEIDELCIVLT